VVRKVGNEDGLTTDWEVNTMKRSLSVPRVACLAMVAFMMMVFPFQAYGEELKLRYSVIWPRCTP